MFHPSTLDFHISSFSNCAWVTHNLLKLINPQTQVLTVEKKAHEIRGWGMTIILEHESINLKNTFKKCHSSNQNFIHSLSQLNVFISLLQDQAFWERNLCTPTLSTHRLIHYTLDCIHCSAHSDLDCFHSTADLLIKITNYYSVAISNGHFWVLDDSAALNTTDQSPPETLFSSGFLLPVWLLFLKFLYWLLFYQ